MKLKQNVFQTPFMFFTIPLTLYVSFSPPPPPPPQAWLSIPHACFFISSSFFPLAPLSFPAELERAIAEELPLIPAHSENVFAKPTALDLAVLAKHSHSLRSAKWEQGFVLKAFFCGLVFFILFLFLFFLILWPKFLYYPLPGSNWIITWKLQVFKP